VLARLNSTLLEAALQLVASGVVTRIGGNIFGAISSSLLLDLHVLWRGGSVTQMSTTDHAPARFAIAGLTYADFKRANSADFGSSCRIVEQLGARLPNAMALLEGRMVSSEGQAQAIFHSTHTAKGMGKPSVFLCGDYLGFGITPSRVATAIATQRSDSHTQMLLLAGSPVELLRRMGRCVEDEANLLYVALTRAMFQVFVHPTTAEWLLTLGIKLPSL